jgi:hypothetical protein
MVGRPAPPQGRENWGSIEANSLQVLPGLRLHARGSISAFFPGQPTSQITDLVIPLDLRRQFPNILGVDS